MKKLVRIIAIIVVVGSIVGGYVWWRSRQTAASSTETKVLRTGEIIRDTLDLSVAASGTIRAQRRLDIAFEVNGMVAEVNVEVGDRVRRGQELARLDEDALARAVRQAELSLEQATANLSALLEPPADEDLKLAQLAIQEAAQAMSVADLSRELAEARAANNIERARDLEEDTREAYESYLDALKRSGLPEAYAAGITAAYMEAQGNVGITQLKSEHAIQQAKSQWSAAYQRYQDAQRNLESLQTGPTDEQIRRLELQIEQAELGLEEAQADLASAAITSPFAGVVAAVNVQEGTQAPVGLPAVSILDDSVHYAEIAVDEIDIGQVYEMQPVSIVVDAYPDVTIEATVDRIEPLPTISGGIIAYPVRMRISDDTLVDIRDGMTASARILVERREDVLLIPNWAVRSDQTSGEIYTYCYCLREGQPSRVPIELGTRSESHTEVISGLQEGDTVALLPESQDLLQFQGLPSRGTP